MGFLSKATEVGPRTVPSPSADVAASLMGSVVAPQKPAVLFASLSSDVSKCLASVTQAPLVA